MITPLTFDVYTGLLATCRQNDLTSHSSYFDLPTSLFSLCSRGLTYRTHLSCAINTGHQVERIYYGFTHGTYHIVIDVWVLRGSHCDQVMKQRSIKLRDQTVDEYTAIKIYAKSGLSHQKRLAYYSLEPLRDTSRTKAQQASCRLHRKERSQSRSTSNRR
jgi:hypothetical protein